MALEYVGGKTAAVTGSTATVTNVSLTDLSGGLASAPAAGDIVIVGYTVAATADRVIGVTTSGYTEVAELYANDTIDANLSVSWKIMGATPDTSVSVSATGGSTDGAVVAIRVWRGADSTTPMDVTPTTATHLNTWTPDPPAITPVTSGAVIEVIGAGAAGIDVSQMGAMSSSQLSNFLTASPAPGGSAARSSGIGVGNFAWSSGSFNPNAFSVSGTSSTTYSAASVTLALRPAASGGGGLTATGVSSGTPTVGSPALGQVHTLTATEVNSGTPTVGSPALGGGTVALTATGVASGTPSVGSPAVGQRHTLTATGVATATPSVGSPAITQTHALTATGVTTSVPSVGSPSLGQVHALTASGVSSGTPSVGSPALSRIIALTATGVSTSAPSVGSPALVRIVALTATGIASGTPSVGSPVLSNPNIVHLIANDLSAGGRARRVSFSSW